MGISRQGALAALGVLAALIGGPLLGAAQQAGGLVERTDTGLIDWSGGYVEAEGAGAASEQAPSAVVARLGARRAAKADAYRNLLETVQGVRVQGRTVVENFMGVSDTIRTRVSGIVKGARELRSDFDGRVATVRLRMPLWGELAAAVVETPPGLTPSYHPFPEGSHNPGYESPEGAGGGMRGRLDGGASVLRRFARVLSPLVAPGSAFAQEPPSPSGKMRIEAGGPALIVDLTKTRIQPELFPKIVDAASGKVIVDARAAGVQTAAAGAVKFAGSLEEAKAGSGGGEMDPVVVRAINLAAGTSDGWTVDFATGLGLETARGLASDPAEVLKKGVSIAYRVSW